MSKSRKAASVPALRRTPLVAALALALTPGISAAFTVSNNGDNGGIDPPANAGTGTLRQALVDANQRDGLGNCVFPGVVISFSGAFTIQPSTPLPGLGCDPVIDGGGAVTLDGVNKSIACGLNAASGFSIVRGLEVTRFDKGLCGSINVYASRIHGNNIGIKPANGAIGDGTSAMRNYVYSNSTANLYVGEGPLIYHNYIGTADGVTAAPGNGIGINVQYGGGVQITSNVISGNTTGVRFHFSNGYVTANFIGTDLAGGAALANNVGVENNCAFPVLTGNTISGNTSDGIKSNEFATIQSNHIGTNPAGTAAVPNGGHGILFEPSGGCTPPGADISENDIANNSGAGVKVVGVTSGVEIRQNRIYANAGRNINLDFSGGPLPNDAGDADTGPNRRQNYPILTSVTSPDGAFVEFMLDSTPLTTFTIDIFSNPAAGAPAGKTLEDTDSVTTDASGIATGTRYLGGSTNHFSLTATNDLTGDTSEFSPIRSIGFEPAVTLSTDLVDFGNVAVGTTSATRTVTISSVGSAPYRINSISDNICYGGPFCYGGSFTCSTTCSTSPTTYSAGLSCQFSASYSPTSLSTDTTTVYLCDNTESSPQTITLVGDGVAPSPVTIAPTGWDFGNVLVGATSPTKSFSIQNPGAVATPIGTLSTTGAFSLVSTTCGASVPAGGSCAAEVAFVPTQPGFVTGELVIPIEDCGCGDTLPGVAASATVATAPLAGTGVQNAELTMPSSVDLGAFTPGGAPITQVVTLTNSGNAVLTFSSITASEPFTAVNNCPLNLAPGASCTVTVGFSATTVGAHNGTLTVMSNAPGGSRAIPLTALVQLQPVPVIRVAPTAIGFGNRMFGTQSAAQRITITNDGGGEAALAGMAVGVDFLIVNTSCGLTLASQSTCFADVAFRPVGFGARAGQFSFNSNAAGSPHVVQMAGTGCRPFTMSNRSGASSACGP